MVENLFVIHAVSGCGVAHTGSTVTDPVSQPPGHEERGQVLGQPIKLR
jgi:hypothetical protein